MGLNLWAYAAPLRSGIKAGPNLSLARGDSVIYNPSNLWAAKLGLSTGIRYHVLKFFFVELQWNWGFRNVVYNPDFPDNAPHRNSTLSLLLGYRR